MERDARRRDKKKNSNLSSFSPPSLPSLSLFLCLAVRLSPSLVSTSLSFPSWQLAMLSLCVSLCADNSRTDLSWTALESGGSCLLLY